MKGNADMKNKEMVTGCLTEENKENISLWQDVTDISVGQVYFVGLTSKGEVLMERIDHVY